MSCIVLIDIGKLLDCREAIPILIECVDLFFRCTSVSKPWCVLMSYTNLLLHLLLLVQLLEQLIEHGIEVSWLFRVALKCTFLHILSEFSFSYITCVLLASLRLSYILTAQDLVSMLIVPSSFLVIAQTLVRLLYCLKYFCCVLVLVLVRMPINSCLLVCLHPY